MPSACIRDVAPYQLAANPPPESAPVFVTGLQFWKTTLAFEAAFVEAACAASVVLRTEIFR